MESSESTFKLQDRTAILTGPPSTMLQAIAQKLTSLGANVALVDSAMDHTQRLASQLMDQREVNDRLGRAAAIPLLSPSANHVLDAITRSAEAFGGVDIYIDTTTLTSCLEFRSVHWPENLERLMSANLLLPMRFSHGVLRFLEGRRRGRIIFLLHDLMRLGVEGHSQAAATRLGLIHFSKGLARELASVNVTVNCVAMGVTEEFLLSQKLEPGLSLKGAHEQLMKAYPQAQLTEPERIANLVAFLASPLAAGVTGQTIAVSQGLSFIS